MAARCGVRRWAVGLGKKSRSGCGGLDFGRLLSTLLAVHSVHRIHRPCLLLLCCFFPYSHSNTATGMPKRYKSSHIVCGMQCALPTVPREYRRHVPTSTSACRDTDTLKVGHASNARRLKRRGQENSQAQVFNQGLKLASKWNRVGRRGSPGGQHGTTALTWGRVGSCSPYLPSIVRTGEGYVHSVIPYL